MIFSFEFDPDLVLKYGVNVEHILNPYIDELIRVGLDRTDEYSLSFEGTPIDNAVLPDSDFDVIKIIHSASLLNATREDKQRLKPILIAFNVYDDGNSKTNIFLRDA